MIEYLKSIFTKKQQPSPELSQTVCDNLAGNYKVNVVSQNGLVVDSLTVVAQDAEDAKSQVGAYIAASKYHQDFEIESVEFQK